MEGKYIWVKKALMTTRFASYFRRQSFRRDKIPHFMHIIRQKSATNMTRAISFESFETFCDSLKDKEEREELKNIFS